MSRVITLKFTKKPLKVGSNELAVLTIREPLVNDHITAHDNAAEAERKGNMVATESFLLAEVTGLPALDIQAMPAAEYRLLSGPLNDFFSSPSTDYGVEFSCSPAS